MRREVLFFIFMFLVGFCFLATGTKRCNAQKQTFVPQKVKTNKVKALKPNLPKAFPSKYPSHVSLAYLPLKERKKEFIKLMLPLIQEANKEVLEERKFLLSIKDKKNLTLEEQEKLRKLKKKYRTSSLKELMKRVDAVPASLVLAQAAIESGWGTSRFFTEANNAFGIYAYSKEAKVKCLKARKSEACLKVYPNLLESVKDYIYNINVGWAYRDFREARRRGASLDMLVKELEKYSALGKQYTELVQNVIKNNNLTAYDSYALSFTGSGSSE